MTIISKVITGTIALVFLLSITACAPEVGSEQWCNNMEETPKGEWSMNDAGNFTKHCIMK